jgi:hypothetical protein
MEYMSLNKHWLWSGVLLASAAWGAEGPYKVEITTNSPTCLSERANADGVSYRCTEFKDNPPSVRLLTPSDTDYILDMAEALNEARERRMEKENTTIHFIIPQSAFPCSCDDNGQGKGPKNCLCGQ